MPTDSQLDRKEAFEQKCKDANNAELQITDEVNVPATVVSVQPPEIDHESKEVRRVGAVDVQFNTGFGLTTLTFAADRVSLDVRATAEAETQAEKPSKSSKKKEADQ